MFLRPIIPLFFCILFVLEASSQDDFGVVFWSPDRNLEWTDFKGSAIEGSSSKFFLDVYVESMTGNNTGLFIQNVYDPKAYVFTYTSYVADDLKTDDLLRYFNVYFDLAAYYAKKIEERMIRARNSKDEMISTNLHIVKGAMIEEWRNESARLSVETQYGIEIERLIIWEDDIERKMLALEKPVFNKSPYSMTLDLTMGPLIGLSEYNEFLSQPYTGVLGIELSKAPYTFHMGLSGGGQSVKQSFNKGNEVFPAYTEPNLFNLFLHTGFQLLDVRRWRIVPRVGVHFSNLSYPSSEENPSSVWATSITAGTTIDYKFNSWNNQGNVHMMFSEVSFRLGTYFYPMSVGEQNLSHVLVTAGIAWRFGPITVSFSD